MWKRPIRLRDELPPNDGIIVVRGGVMGHTAVERTCGRNHERFGFYGLSVLATLDMDLDELCRAHEAVSQYHRIRTTRCGDIRRSGFPLLSTGHRPHFDIVLADTEDRTIARLTSCFGAAEPNRAGP